MKVLFDIKLPRSIGGEEIIAVIKKMIEKKYDIYSNDFCKSASTIIEGRQLYTVGLSSKFPYRDVVIATGPEIGSSLPELDPKMTYTKLYAMSYDFNLGMKYAVGCEEAPTRTDAVRRFRDEIEKYFNG